MRMNIHAMALSFVYVCVCVCVCVCVYVCVCVCLQVCMCVSWGWVIALLSGIKQDSPDSSYIFYAIALEWAIYLRNPGSFCWQVIRKTKSWALGTLAPFINVWMLNQACVSVMKVKSISHSVMSNFLQPHGLYESFLNVKLYYKLLDVMDWLSYLLHLSKKK